MIGTLSGWSGSCGGPAGGHGHGRRGQGGASVGHVDEDRVGAVTGTPSLAQAPRRRRLRRPLQRARDLVRHRRQRARRDRPRRVRRRPDRHRHATAAGCWSPATPTGCASTGPDALPSVDGDRAPVVAGARRATAPTSSSPTPSQPAARPSARSTSSSRSCTARGARTARSRACSRWPASATSAPACSPRRSAWTRPT